MVQRSMAVQPTFQRPELEGSGEVRRLRKVRRWAPPEQIAEGDLEE